jgi:hypothetical protein
MNKADTTTSQQADTVTFDDIIACYRASEDYPPAWVDNNAAEIIAKVRSACEAKDYGVLHSLRDPDNAFTRDVFTRLTGTRLHPLQRESRRILEEYVGPERVAAYEDAQARQRTERRARSLQRRVSLRSVSFRGGVLSMDAFIRLLIGEGYTHLSELPRGAAKQYALANDQRSSFMFYRRDERDYIEYCLKQQEEAPESQVTDGNAPA